MSVCSNDKDPATDSKNRKKENIGKRNMHKQKKNQGKRDKKHNKMIQDKDHHYLITPFVI